MHLLDHLPNPDKRNIAVYVKPAAERAIRDGHPWVFDNSIRETSKSGDAGDIAVLFDQKGRFMAAGMYDPASPIRVRLFIHGDTGKIGYEMFKQRLEAALLRRAPLADAKTTGYRLVYGEGDYLPGLIIDHYAETLVLKIYTSAWFAHLRELVQALNELLPDMRLVLRLSRYLQRENTYGLNDGQILQGLGIYDPIQFYENSLLFQADVIDGHKTGFFFDQRDNRQRVRNLAKGKHVLDVFSYNGGFSVSAAAGSAKSVTSLDISAPALHDAQANMTLNHAKVSKCEHHTIQADAFDGLADLASKNKQYDLVIVDPPSFAKSQNDIDKALAAYTRLIQLALHVTAPEGKLMMASCSSRISSDAFYKVVHNTAIRAGRPLQELERSQHALDHPTRETFPEGEYLKALFATVP